MKKLEELDIQPTPWTVEDDGCVVDTNGEYVNEYTPGMDSGDPTANLVAAAPELYKALHEAIVEVCHDCPSCGSCLRGYACHEKKGKYFVQRWRKVQALYEAARAKRKSNR